MPSILLPMMTRHRKRLRDARKAVIDAVCAPPLDPDADTPFTPVTMNQVFNLSSSKPTRKEMLQANEDNVELVLKEAGHPEFHRARRENETMYVVVVEEEVGRRALVDDMQATFKKIQMDPKRDEQNDEGWRCCSIENPDRPIVVHLLSREAFDYYRLAEIGN